MYEKLIKEEININLIRVFPKEAWGNYVLRIKFFFYTFTGQTNRKLCLLTGKKN